MACGKHCDICPMLHSVRNIFFKQIYAKHVWSDSSQVGKEGKGENIILLRTSRLPMCFSQSWERDSSKYRESKISTKMTQQQYVKNLST